MHLNSWFCMPICRPRRLFPGGASSGARPRGKSPGCGSCAARPGARWRTSRETGPRPLPTLVGEAVPAPAPWRTVPWR
eukprot:2117692-Heterocapsa_arctica.AAC.1